MGCMGMLHMRVSSSFMKHIRGFLKISGNASVTGAFFYGQTSLKIRGSGIKKERKKSAPLYD
jgi:hypothetical protein